MTTIVNVKVAHLRPKYDNLAEWMKDPNNVYIGRGGIVFINGERFPKVASPWANPYKVGKDGNIDRVLELYSNYIVAKCNRGEINIYTLYNKTLGCWCKPDRCHGDVLINIINYVQSQQQQQQQQPESESNQELKK